MATAQCCRPPSHHPRLSPHNGQIPRRMRRSTRIERYRYIWPSSPPQSPEMSTRRMNERETDDQTLLVPFRCAWLGRRNGRCRAAQDPPIGPGAELALELHDAPDLGPVNPHVRFYVCSNPVNGCQEVATGTPGPTWMPGAPVATFLQLPRSRPPTTPPAATSHPVASAARCTARARLARPGDRTRWAARHRPCIVGIVTMTRGSG